MAQILLALSSGQSLADLARVDVIEDLIAQCGGVPLALSAIGGSMVQHPAEDWHERLDQIRSADLTGLHVESEYEYDYVLAALRVSFNALREPPQPCFLELAKSAHPLEKVKNPIGCAKSRLLAQRTHAWTTLSYRTCSHH
jgi:hypothetical protein